MSEKLSWEC